MSQESVSHVMEADPVKKLYLKCQTEPLINCATDYLTYLLIRNPNNSH